jgi:hypothetical protein
MGVVIYQGRRYRVVAEDEGSVSLAELARPSAVIRVSRRHVDLLLDPSDDDLHMADAYERGEINAFEYPDGHTFPPHQEIRRYPPGSEPPEDVH